MRKLRKLKFDPATPGLFVAWEDWDEKAGRLEEHTLKCNERPRTALLEAFRDLRGHLVTICELPESWEEQIRIRGLTVKENKEGTRAIVISGIRKLAGSHAPLVLNTPYMVEEADDEVGVFSDECAEDLDALAALVWKYLDGDREQRQLPLEELRPDGLRDQPIELRLNAGEREIAEDIAVAGGISFAGKRSRMIIE